MFFKKTKALMTENGISKYVEHFLKDGHIAAISGQFHCTPHGGYSTDPSLESMSDCNEGFLDAPLVQPE